jgi:hypothetical protein
MHKTEYEESVKKPMEELVEAPCPRNFPDSLPEFRHRPESAFSAFTGTRDFQRIRLQDYRRGRLSSVRYQGKHEGGSLLVPQRRAQGFSSRLNYSRGFSFIVEYRIIENDDSALL